MNNTSQNKLILDCDTGEDDAIALLLAVCSDLPLTHVVTSFGNTTIENSTRNSADILHLAQATNTTVIRGSQEPQQTHPFESSNAIAGDFVGKNGICGIELEPNSTIAVRQSPDDQHSEEIIAALKHNKRSDYIVTGPQTNLASVCARLGNDITNYIDTVYIMGGAVFKPGNSGPKDEQTGAQHAEFNLYCDPHAAHTVLHSGLKIRYVTWDVCSDITIPYSQVQAFTSTTPVGNFAVDLMKAFLESYGIEHERDFELSDPVTVLAYIGYGSYKTIAVDINTDTSAYGVMREQKDGVQIEYFELADKTQAISHMIRTLHIQ